MSDKYKLELEDILARGPAMLGRLEEAQTYDSAVFFRETWEFIFELSTDLEVAMKENDLERQKIYIGGINATRKIVRAVLDEIHIAQILGDQS